MKETKKLARELAYNWINGNKAYVIDTLKEKDSLKLTCNFTYLLSEDAHYSVMKYLGDL